MSKSINVRTPSGDYEVLIGSKLLGNYNFKWLVQNRQILVVKDSMVPNEILETLRNALSNSQPMEIKILEIETRTLGAGDQAVSTLVKEIQNSSEKPISITINRDGALKDLTLVPKNIDGKGTIGAQLQPNIRKETKKTKNVFELFKYTNNEFSSLLIKTIDGYKGLVTNFSSTAQQLSGPVKIVEIGAQLSQQGGTGILLFAALISINLAVLNSLPLPLLDGGQLVFTLIEGFRGKPVPVKVQMVVTQSSFFLLVGLSVLLIIRDTSQLLIVQRLLNQ